MPSLLATKREPTQKRGAELAREILTEIEAEEERRQKLPGEILPELTKNGNAWNQGTWASLFTDSLPSGVEVEVLRPEVYQGLYNPGSDFGIIAFSPGLSCGTAMCFAGHAALAVGDRFATGVYAQDIDKQIGKRKNWRRLAHKLEWDDADVQDVFTIDGKYVSIRQRAQELLGLDVSEAVVLFRPENTLYQLQQYVGLMEQGLHLVSGSPKQ